MAKLPKEAAIRFRDYAKRLMVIFHPQGYFNWIGIHDAHGDSQPGDWTFMMIMSWIPDDRDYDVMDVQGEKILKDLKRRSEIFEEGIQFMWKSIPERTKCWHNRLSYWIPEQWDSHNGTVTLVGDAAHPMTFRTLRPSSIRSACTNYCLLNWQTVAKASTTRSKTPH